MTSELRLSVGMYDLCKPRYIILILGKLTDQQFYSKFFEGCTITRMWMLLGIKKIMPSRGKLYLP